MKIVVAYSGGLDTSVLLKWLKEKYNAEIIAYCADVGQAEELDGLEAKALATGASKCFIGDLKEDFAANYIFPMMAGQRPLRRPLPAGHLHRAPLHFQGHGGHGHP